MTKTLELGTCCDFPGICSLRCITADQCEARNRVYLSITTLHYSYSQFPPDCHEDIFVYMTKRLNLYSQSQNVLHTNEFTKETKEAAQRSSELLAFRKERCSTVSPAISCDSESCCCSVDGSSSKHVTNGISLQRLMRFSG